MLPFLQDVRFAARRLGRQRVATVTMVMTVALVTGAGTSVATFINAAIIRPLDYPDADRLVGIHSQLPGTSGPTGQLALHALDIIRFRERITRADSVEGAWPEDKIISVDASGEPVSVPAARVTPGFLAMFGGKPALGRLWSAGEATNEARVCVISYGLWQRLFAGDPAVVGRSVVIDRQPHVVVGVLQKGFRPTYIASELWTPLILRMDQLPPPKSTFIPGFARLAPGATAAQLGDELAAVMKQLAVESPSTHAGQGAGVDSLRQREFGNQNTAAACLAAAVIALALIGIANLANIRLARLIAERGDLALRLALGAGRWDLVRAQIVEGMLVAGAGGAMGCWISRLTLPVLERLDPQTFAAIGPLPVDWRVLTTAIVVAAVVAIGSGLLPVWRESGVRRDLALGLRTASRRTTGSIGEARIRRGLVSAEAALALLLLVCVTVFTAALAKSATNDLGFDPSNLLVGQLRMPAAVYPTNGARAAFAAAVLERVRAVPGVLDAATTLNPFVPGRSYITAVAIDGHPSASGEPYSVNFRRISDRYFSTLRVPILQGRAIEASDHEGTRPVAMVSRSFARKYWPGEDAVGKRAIRSDVTYTVVGIAEDVEDQGAGSSAAEMFYIPFAQNSASVTGATLVVRTGPPPLTLSPAIRAAVLSVDSSQPLEKINTIDTFLSDSLGTSRFRGALLLSLAALGLLLTTAGIYGVTSCHVEERLPELAVRLVLGASPRGLSRMVVAHAIAAVAMGSAAGAVMALGAIKAIRGILPGAAPPTTPVWHDLWSALPAAVVLVVAACVAAVLPARRAARADANEVLR